MYWAYAAIMVSAFGAITVLVIYGHPWFALAVFVSAWFTEFKRG